MTLLDLPCAPYDFLVINRRDDVGRIQQFDAYMDSLERARVAVSRDLAELSAFVQSIPDVRWDR